MGVNAILILDGVPVAWGARTLQCDAASEWKYIPVRRTALLIEESVTRETRWALFEPNDEPVWARIRSVVGAFLHQLFRLGAFAGRTDDRRELRPMRTDTMTQRDIEEGSISVVVGFAPLRPAEFVVLRIRQRGILTGPSPRATARLGQITSSLIALGRGVTVLLQGSGTDKAVAAEVLREAAGYGHASGGPLRGGRLVRRRD